ncbi:hypothetical protein JCM17380_01350 [Desulfosporosinus burensis]
MEAVIGLVMLAGALVIIGYPLIQKDIHNLKVKTAKNKPLGYEQQKEIVMSSIGEIEFDFNMNKLTVDDYQELKALYKEKAVRLLKDNDKVSRVNEMDLVRKLEEEIEADLKSLKGSDADEKG